MTTPKKEAVSIKEDVVNSNRSENFSTIKNFLFFRRVTPATGHAFFFPNRSKDKRVVLGKSVQVNWGEEWKHLQLGQFEIRISTTNQKSLIITTEEGLPCDVDAEFQISIGGNDNLFEERIERATSTCAPQKADHERVDIDFFQSLAKSYCTNAIKVILKEKKFIQLFEDSIYRATAAKEIVINLQDRLDRELGLVLVDGQVLIVPKAPQGVHATPDILAKWRNALIARSKEEMLTEQGKKRLDQENAFYDEELKSNLAKAKDQRRVEEKQRERDTQDKLRAIQNVLDGWNEEIQKLHIQREFSIEGERLRLQEEQDEHRRQEEFAALKTELV
jgi:hypothetical protein